jgi:hypothetical protein
VFAHQAPRELVMPVAAHPTLRETTEDIHKWLSKLLKWQAYLILSREGN